MKRSLFTICVTAGFLGGLTAQSLCAQAPTEYKVSFLDAIHHVVQVEITFHDVPPGPLRVEMSRSSPGRYAAFDFAANVLGEHFSDSKGKALTVSKLTPRSWEVAGHKGTVTVTYRVFGNRVDGTFASIDSTHAHLNPPAVLMWAQGFDNRPARLIFLLPPDLHWKVATQLYPTADPTTFTAPNFAYLMDSPVELSNFALRTFLVPSLTVGGKVQTVRIVAHHQGSETDLTAYAADVAKIVREEQAIFGELPEFETGTYTFLLDYLPSNQGDGMEHRNSTVITSRRKLSDPFIVYTAAHEFFHTWNIKRIRPATLEPFDFTDVNMSGELWLAEGFTNYYSRLAMLRSGLLPLQGGLAGMGGEINEIHDAPAARYRSAMDLSRLAPFEDGANQAMPTYGKNTFVSYYSAGDIIALGLDLMLRDRSGSRVTLDDFMRAMWQTYGKREGGTPGTVAKPYTMADVRSTLAAVSGDRVFADRFVQRYVEGTEQIDYAPLLLRAGFLLRQRSDSATLGEIRLEKKGENLQVTSPTLIGSPAYMAGLDQDDELLSIGGLAITSPDDLGKILAGRKPGDTVEMAFRRQGQEMQTTATLVHDPDLEIVPVESTGGRLSDEQQQFRDAWLKSKVRN